MIKLLAKQSRGNIKEVCNRWIAGNFTVKEIKNNIGTLDWAVVELLPELENEAHVSTIVNILIDDILEMDSITDEEKDQSILELVEGHKEELQSLAKRVIAQIEINTQEYLEWYQKEAEERGFCRKLTEEVIERNIDKEDG
ncbi:hypothetical protein [Candidatus Tisiphia endosymbiont of Temnostethus pusillus]|uniref:hypothetical protein n=1 Tax=Candidatus Tisiphia endosymbiont of Temnostethus pusillus TaxID=3139335 RepID=UPI0035C94203